MGAGNTTPGPLQKTASALTTEHHLQPQKVLLKTRLTMFLTTLCPNPPAALKHPEIGSQIPEPQVSALFLSSTLQTPHTSISSSGTLCSSFLVSLLAVFSTFQIPPQPTRLSQILAPGDTTHCAHAVCFVPTGPCSTTYHPYLADS